MSEFQRSSLTIQPKQRLMSAGSFINPVRTYDANEQMRIVESFRSLSAQSDALIDSFIKKKQEEGQKKADMYMTDALLDPNHPDHKKAKEMMNGLKPQAVNLLGVDYWTQQYIGKAQAKQIMKKEEYEMLDGIQKYANLSPDEFRVKLGEIRAKTDNELATYPQVVRDYFVRMPRQELTDRIRDEHYKGIMKEQLATRDTIFKNKIINAMDNTDTGLLNIESNMLSEEEFRMRYAEFTAEERKNIDQQAIKLGEILGDVPVVVGANNKIIKTEMFDDYANKIVAVKGSSLYQEMREYVLEAADIGTNSQTIQANLLEGMKGAIDKGNDEEIVAAAYLVLMTELNTDKELTSALGSWRYGNKPVDKNNKGIVNFDLALAETSAKELLNYGASVKARELERARIGDYYEKKEQQEFLELLARSEVITKQDWLTLDGWQIAEKAGGLDYYKYADAINAYKEAVTKGFNIPYTDKHRKQFGDTLYAIQTGRIKDKETITQMAATGRDFHINDYPALLKAFDEQGGAKAEENMRRVKMLMYRVEQDIAGAVADNLLSEREANAHLAQLEKMVLADLERGIYDKMPLSTAINEVWELAQNMNIIAKGKKIYSKGIPDETTLQTEEQYNKGIVSHLADKQKDETGITQPTYYVRGDTYEEWIKDDPVGQAVNSNTTLTEEQKQIIYNSMTANTKYAEYQTREKEIREMLKKGGYTHEEFTKMVVDRPDLVEDILGMKYVIEYGKAFPSNAKAKKLLTYYINDKKEAFSDTIEMIASGSRRSSNAYAE